MLNRALFIWLVLVGVMIFDSPALSQQPGAKKSWQSVDKIPQNRPASDAWVHPGKNFHAFNVDHGSLRAELARVPKEFSNQARIAPGEISLPMPDGSLARFKVVESPVMAPELAAKFPEIKTYLGQGIDDPQASVRFDTTPAGFHAQILSPKGAVYIDPYWRGDAVLHTSYYKRDYQKAADGFQCLAPTVDVANEKPVAQRDLLRSGNNLRTYRLACAATGEYVAYHGGTVVAGMSAIVTAVNRVTGIYEVELAIRLVLVANNDLVVYTIGGSDPYSNASGSTMLGQNQANLDSEIGDANYDIGHVFSTGGGGIAGLGVVCRSSNKARGVTGFPSPIGDAFYVDYVAHEMGHQFGGNHTFNSVTSSCGGPNRNTLTAYEPGSGSTIMAYAGICAGDNLQPHSDSYFHSGSFDEILAYSTSGLGSGCPVLTATGNTAPTVNAGTNFVIPKSTPFTLTATGSDADGDLLSFCWEERDLGADQVLTDGDNGSSPIFRSLNPTASPSRTFPTLTSLLNNTSILGEKLPTTSRTMNFRVTARDNRPDGGGVNTANMQVTVNSSVGPFLVVSPNSAVTWSNLQTVTWSVAGTTSAPVNVASVNILLSTNGGNSFPISLATNTPNDGSEIIRLPSISNSLARIKIEAVGNIFFDISNTNFSIVPFVPVAIDSTALIAENCSPGNNAIDPSETVIVNFALKNVGTANTTNLTATLLATNGVTPLSGAQNYGALVAGGGAVTQAFVFSASGSCGGTIRPTFQLQDGATNLGTINIPLTLGSVTFVSLTNSNSTPIVIPASGNSGPTSPYPSPVTISGASGVLSKATVSLLNLSHTFPDDIDVLLVAPNGQTVLLMSDAGGSTSISNVNLTFDSLAATALPDSSPLVSGTYLPTDFEAGEAFTAPAPTGPYGLSLTNLNGMNPNGTWSLYIIDDSNPNKGSIAGGWQLTLTTSIATCCASNSPPVITSVSNQITDEDVPLSGISFTVSDAETAANALIITTNSSNTNLVANSGLAISGTGTNRSLAITPLLNQSGNSTITISVSDGQSTTNTTFLLTVNPVNDAPVVATIPSPMTINEGALLQFTNSATDVEGNQLTFSLDPGFPGGASIDPITGVFTWTPTEAQAPATNSITVRVTDNGSPNLSGTRTFTVIANEVNAAPALAEIPSPVTIDEGTLLIFTNSATDVEEDQLTFSLEPGFPAGAAINPTNGVFTWTPTEAQGPGTNSITIRVTDNGSPNLSDTKTFSVVVNEVNNAPTLAAISPQAVDEGTLLQFTNSATDPETNQLTFSLEPGAPDGAEINSTNGVFTWTPTEAQGPNTNTISIRVTDDGSPNLSDTKTFTVVVNEVNVAPSLTQVSNKFVYVGMTVSFTNIANDSDLPTNILQFSFDLSATNAELVATNGVFVWTPTEDQLGTNDFTVRVTDDGVPALSDAKSFSIMVVSLPTILSVTELNGDVTLTWNSIPEQNYRVQYKTDLDGSVWNDLSGDVTASGSSASKTDSSGLAEQMFYRILVLP